MRDICVEPEVVVVVLNYRGSTDTIACVNSLLGDKDQSLMVVVCDNNSMDGSENLIRNSFAFDERVVVLQTGQNGGFAYGNNVGIKAALSMPSVKFIWILNNDTIVRPGCIDSLRQIMESDRTIGIVGATLVYHDRPDVIQARGGSSLNRWTSISQHIGNGESLRAPVNVKAIEDSLDFVSGASMFVSRRFVEEVGFLSEAYFLYFEEADWMARSKGRFRVAYCPEAVIEHKEGASIGSSSANRLANPFSVYHICRSRLIFTRSHRWWALPTVLFRMLRYLGGSLVSKRWGTARSIFLAMSGQNYR